MSDETKARVKKSEEEWRHCLTPEQYRQRWNLPGDYPMVAPNYATKRRELAKKIGLGRKPGAKRGQAKVAAPAAKAAAPAKATRRSRKAAPALA